MRKYILPLLLLLVLPINVFAKNQLSLNCDKNSLKEFEEFTCRTSLSSTFEFNKVILELDLSKGITLNEARSNYTSLWKLELKDNILTAETRNEILVNGLQEFGILLLESLSYGEQTINIKNIKLINTKEDKTENLSDLEQKIKVLSSENKLKSIYIDYEKYDNFSSNVFSYIINIDKNTTTVNLEADPIDVNSKIIGTGEIQIEVNNQITVVPITVKSESGVNRNYILYLVRDTEILSLIQASNIELKDDKKNLIDFNFQPDVYEYNLEVDSKTSSISFNMLLEDSKFSFVKNFGNRTVNIEDGDNTILIKIKNSEGEEKTYIFNITKLLSNKSANYYLKSLTIDKYDLKFNKRVKNYNLAIKKSTKKLNISAIPEDGTSVITIMGNDNLTEGSVVKIVVKAENESRFTYLIQISYAKNSTLINIIYFIVFIMILGAIWKLYQNYIKINKLKLKTETINVEVKANKQELTKKETKANTISKKKPVEKVGEKLNLQSKDMAKKTPKQSEAKPKKKPVEKSVTTPKSTTKGGEKPSEKVKTTPKNKPIEKAPTKSKPNSTTKGTEKIKTTPKNKPVVGVKSKQTTSKKQTTPKSQTNTKKIVEPNKSKNNEQKMSVKPKVNNNLIEAKNTQKKNSASKKNIPKKKNKNKKK